ncbi:DUF6168 family protein [Flavobacteriaceae bacterium]|nr:DUF6168 family protein [Flavobacteriaceae bacterium]MDC0118201.1 DUF6168 family protein [bacterium]
MLKHPIILFSSRLLLVIFLAFAIHLFILQNVDLPLFDHKILASYSINTLLTILIVTTLYKLKDSYSNQIGFLFLGSSFVKFIAFFLVFHGAYKADGTIETLEFLTFFIPYGICLIFETYFLSKWLNEI